MARPRKRRFVEDEPAITYFKPRGIPISELDEVTLSVEELEALKHADMNGFSQEETAERMGVSRATVQRVLTGARRKVARVLVEGMALGVSGGDYVAVGPERILGCASCGNTWELPFGSGVRACEAVCPDCGSRNARRVDSRGAGKRKYSAGRHGCCGSGRGSLQGDLELAKGDA
ncbi:MAG: DUF134 domain-containing protein [Actinobacteria bacterium]|nr:DUF134 domain-containing protein [Actinomycetota bacterium]